MSRTEREPGGPQAVIHKQILDVAESNPDACLEEIAEEVSGASTDLVDRVLAKYGDPSEEPEDEGGGPAIEPPSRNAENDGSTSEEPTVDESDSASNTDQKTSGTDADGLDVPPERDGLSEKQLDALRLVREHPDATQRDLAEQMDVTAATVSRRLNAIPGFEWTRREEIARSILAGSEPDGSGDRAGNDSTTQLADGGVGGSDETASRDGTGTSDVHGGTDAESRSEDGEHPRTNGGSPTNQEDRETGGTHVDVETLRERTEGIEARIDELEGQSGIAGIDPALAHKVVHACMDAEYVSQEDELDLLRALME